MPNVWSSREWFLCLLGEFSGSWDGSQSLTIFGVVVDVCAKAAMLDAPKGSTDNSRNKKSNPVKFIFPRGHFEERGVEFVRTWKEMSTRLYGLDRMLGLEEAARRVYRSDFTSAGTQSKFLLALTWSRNDLQPTGFHTSVCISLNEESSHP